MKLFKIIRLWYWRKKYYENRELELFIARDIKRYIRIIGTEKINDGILIVQIKTVNVLYEAKNLVKSSEYGLPAEIKINDLWKWSGEKWGGLADGNSIADKS